MWLINYIDSIEAPFNCVNCKFGQDGISKTLYQIPVNAVVHYNNNYPNISNQQVEAYINGVNKYFEESDVLIHLYIRCSIKQLPSDKAYVNTVLERGQIFDADNESNCLNIHFVNDVDPNIVGGDFNGMAKYPWVPAKYKIIVATYNSMSSINTLAHEIGHSLGLPHTFNKNICRNDCFQECVSRTRTQETKCFFTAGKKKCEVNGDGFCDTDADVKYDDDYIESYNCSSVTFTSNAENCKMNDNYGDNFFSTGNNNALKNIMSYWSSCREDLTKMQRGAMYLYTIKSGPIPSQNNNTAFYDNPDLDVYENDNYYQPYPFSSFTITNVITLNSIQYHTFHHTYNPTTACDIDWLYFKNNTGGIKSFIIQTMEVIGKPKPDTKITLYNVNASTGALGAQIATHDNINTTNKFSKLIRNLAVGSYAVKIENKITSTSDEGSKGHYYIRVDDCYEKNQIYIQADNYVCSNTKTASLVNAPTGTNYTITWTAVGLTLTGPVNGTSVQYYRSSPGFSGKLIATITSNNGCGSYSVEKEINIAAPRSWSSPFGLNTSCDFGLETGLPIKFLQGSTGVISITFNDHLSNGITGFEWDLSAACGYQVSTNTYTTSLGLRSDFTFQASSNSPGACGSISVRPVNECGEKGNWKTKSVELVASCGGGWSMMISPNPSNSYIRLELSNENTKSLIQNPYRIEIVDLYGKTYYSTSSDEKVQNIDISNMKEGMYKAIIYIDSQILSQSINISR